MNRVASGVSVNQEIRRPIATSESPNARALLGWTILSDGSGRFFVRFILASTSISR